jgi:hypothetical protein
VQLAGMLAGCCTLVAMLLVQHLPAAACLHVVCATVRGAQWPAAAQGTAGVAPRVQPMPV